jgi:hypothetical protein
MDTIKWRLSFMMEIARMWMCLQFLFFFPPIYILCSLIQTLNTVQPVVDKSLIFPSLLIL